MLQDDDGIVKLVLLNQWRREWREFWRAYCKESNAERDPSKHSRESLERFCCHAARRFAKEAWFLDATLQIKSTPFSKALQHFALAHRGEDCLEEVGIANRVAVDLVRVNQELNFMWQECIEEATAEVDAAIANEISHAPITAPIHAPVENKKIWPNKPGCLPPSRDGGIQHFPPLDLPLPVLNQDDDQFAQFQDVTRFLPDFAAAIANLPPMPLPPILPPELNF